MKKRIGFIAMSGVRANNPKVAAAGLTFPGVMERGRVIASLPSLSLLTLAALTPSEEFEIEYHEARDVTEGNALPTHFDLVAMTSLSAQVLDAYALARRYRELRIPVVMGGLHVSACTDEALAHCTAVVAGEGEEAWPSILEDFRAGRLGGVYRAEREFDLANAPVPRFDLLNIEKYNRLTVQTSRGCPHNCEFCASSIQLTRRYKLKPVEKIAAEVEAIKGLWSKPFIEFADDNSFVNRAHARELMEELKEQKVQWFTEVDVSIAEDEDLLRMMREAGCRQLLIGLESPRAEGLDGLEQRTNWKLKQFDRYEWAIRKIQSQGITVNACFILGLDGDGPEVFENVHDFVQRNHPFDVQLTVLTPFPGTPLYERLLNAGRLLEAGNWNTCTLFDVNFTPAKMSAEELQWGLIELAGKVYAPEAVRARRQRFFEEADRRKVRSAMPREKAMRQSA